MTEDEKIHDFYTRLTQQLQDDTIWPSPYLYKFIVPAELEKIAEIEAVFNHMDAVIQTRDSSKGNYTSVSVRVIMVSPEAVVEKYKEVSKVEGVISL
jgi:putative lipoic acid-binding regulatory protein